MLASLAVHLLATVSCCGESTCWDEADADACVARIESAASEGTERGLQRVPRFAVVPPRQDPFARLVLVDSCSPPTQPLGYGYPLAACVVADILDPCLGQSLSQPFEVIWGYYFAETGLSVPGYYVPPEEGRSFWVAIDTDGVVRRVEAATESGGCYQ